MPLDKLIERIVGDARERAETITGDSQQKRDEMLEEARARSDDVYNRLVAAARKAAEEEKRRMVTLATLEARRELLEEKQALLKEVFDRALQAILNLPRGQYLELLVRLLVAAVRDVDTGEAEGEVILSSMDRERVGEQMVLRANEELSGGGEAGNITLSDETRDISGGFIFKTRGFETNSALEAVISVQREELERRLVEILFPAG